MMKKKLVTFLWIAMCVSMIGGCGSTTMTNSVSDGDMSSSKASNDIVAEAGVVSYQNVTDIKVFANDAELVTLNDQTNMYADLSIYNEYGTQSTAYTFQPGNIISTDMQGSINMIYGDEIYSSSFDSIESLNILYHDHMTAKNIAGNFVMSVYFNDMNDMNSTMNTEQIVLTANTGEDVIESVSCSYDVPNGSVTIQSSKKDMTLNIGAYIVAEDGNSGMFFKEVQLENGTSTVLISDIIADYKAEMSGEEMQDTTNQVDTQITIE